MLARTLGLLVVFLFVVGLVNFADGVYLVGECSVGPAADTSCTHEEIP